MLKFIFAVHYLKYLYFICIYLLLLLFLLKFIFSLLPLTLSPFLSQLFDMRIRLKAQRVDIDGCQVVFKAHSFFTSCLDWTMNCTGEKKLCFLKKRLFKTYHHACKYVVMANKPLLCRVIVGVFLVVPRVVSYWLKSTLRSLWYPCFSDGSSPVYLIVCQAKRAQHTQ